MDRIGGYEPPDMSSILIIRIFFKIILAKNIFLCYLINRNIMKGRTRRPMNKFYTNIDRQIHIVPVAPIGDAAITTKSCETTHNGSFCIE